jgi:hypothetical protein
MSLKFPMQTQPISPEYQTISQFYFELCESKGLILSSDEIKVLYFIFDRLCGLVPQIQRPGFDSRRYQIFWEVVGPERGTLSLVSTTE